MDIDPAVHASLLATIPQLRAFAISLCRNSEQADDPVQDALLRAYSHIAGFQPGTNMAGWLFTTLRNQFYLAPFRQPHEGSLSRSRCGFHDEPPPGVPTRAVG
jgi:DNA-directed RNA polymerase specialized sigma24 family protein